MAVAALGSTEVAAQPALAGIVLGPDGEPLPRVRVTLSRVLSPWPELRTRRLERVLTGEDGRFALGTPRAPDLHVMAEKAGLAVAEAEVSSLAAELVLRMEDGFTVEGLVESPVRRPLDGCAVILEPMAFSDHRAVRTQAEGGRFVFRDVPAGSYRLTAWHPLYRPAVIPSVEVGATKVHRLRFSGEPALVLRGEIVTAAGGEQPQPVAGAAVYALPSSWNSDLFLPVVARTDERGRFVMRGLGPGNLRVEVHHPEHSTKVRLLALSDEHELSIELVPRSRVRGRLVGDGVGAGHVVEIHQQGEIPLRSTTDAEGRFALDVELSAGNAELELPSGEFCFEQSSSRWVSVQIEEDGETELELPVVPASVVRGRVRDAAGQPIAGVRVLWFQPTAGPLAPLELLAVTDAAGSYEVRGLPRGIGLGPVGATRFVFRRRGYAIDEVEFSGATPGEIVELEPVTLVRPGAITGRVTRDGRPIAGAVVFSGGARRSQRDVTGPDGAFRLRDLPPGRYRVKASYAAMPLLLSGEIVELTAGAEVGPIEVQLPPGRTIDGRVVAPDGSPVGSALVVLRGRAGGSFYVEADGSFALEVPQEDVEIQVFADSERRVDRVVRVPRDQDAVVVELPLVADGTVVAKVLGLPTRSPVARAVLRLRSLDPEDTSEVIRRQRNLRSRWVELRGGELRLLGFPAGRSELVMDCGGYAPFVAEIDLHPDGLVDLGTVLLEPGAHVAGRVTDAGGRPIAGVRVLLGDELDLVAAPADAGVFTDAEGLFRIHGVSPYSGRLVVSAEGFAVQVRELEVPGDLLRTEPLQIELGAGAALTVCVAGGAAAGELATVVLKKDGQIVTFGRTDENGCVTFEHCSTGSYLVEMLDEPGEAQQVEVAGSGDFEVMLRRRDGR